jgi:hypothetical protein
MRLRSKMYFIPSTLIERPGEASWVGRLFFDTSSSSAVTDYYFSLQEGEKETVHYESNLQAPLPGRSAFMRHMVNNPGSAYPK